ncbi:peptide ABC transporter substrate-binding protein [Nonomuraea dietziae]|uniref:peptide ABC transporter substrate-binding protein n=1 Tax=Nonomuraea dietziae TaxID=65515 RepID=UPI003435C4EC
MRVTKGARIVAGTALLAVAVAACGGGGGGTATNDGGGSSAQPVRVDIAKPQHELSPTNTNDTSGAEVLNALFVGLVDYDKDKNVILRGAESIEPDAESKMWTIKLKDGYKFHNGEAVTAKSYVDAWNAAAYGPNVQEGGHFFSAVKGYEDVAPVDPDGEEGPQKAPEPKAKTLAGLKVVDDKTFTVELAHPYSGFKTMLGYTTFMPMPSSAFDGKGGIKREFGENPIGNGPFKMAKPFKLATDTTISMVRYDEFVEGKAKIDAVEFKISSDKGTSWNELRAGNLDIMDQLPPEAIATAKQELGDRYIEQPSSGVGYFGFNARNGEEWAKNPELRKAVSMAIDRKTITEQVFSGTRVPADDFVSPIVAGYRKGACVECVYDPAKAKALWEKNGGGKGPVSLSYNGDGGHKEWIEAAANNLRQNLGVEVKVDSFESFAAILDELDKGKVTGGFRMAWIMDYPSMENYLRPIFGTGGSSNHGRYSNKDFDELLVKGDSAKSDEEGVKFYQQAGDMLVKDMPYIPVYFYQTNAGYSQRVKNVTIDPFERIDLAKVERVS